MTTTTAGHGKPDAILRELLTLGLALLVFDAAVVVSVVLQDGADDGWVTAALWGAAGAAAVLPLMVMAHVAPRLRRFAVIAGVAALLALLVARALLGRPGGEAATSGPSSPAALTFTGDAKEVDTATHRLSASRERFESQKRELELKAHAPGEAGRYGRTNLRAYRPVIRAVEKFDRESAAMQSYLAGLSGPKSRDQVTRLLEHTDRILAAIDDVQQAVQRFPENARAAARGEGVPPEHVEAWLRDHPSSPLEREFLTIREGMLEIRERYRGMLHDGRWEGDVLVDEGDAHAGAKKSRPTDAGAPQPDADRDLRRP